LDHSGQPGKGGILYALNGYNYISCCICSRYVVEEEALGEAITAALAADNLGAL
jgi:hypothetical protein